MMKKIEKEIVKLIYEDLKDGFIKTFNVLSMEQKKLYADQNLQAKKRIRIDKPTNSPS